MGPQDLDALLAGPAEVVPADGLRDKLALGRPLRVKLGLDPTAPAVTLGWAVVLWKLRQFQDAGHTAVLIVGDFTARVGDPSGKSETRPRLSKEEVDGFADRLLEQFWLVLDRQRTEVRRNSEWLEELDIEGVLRLTASTTVARMLERDDFALRYAQGRPISLMEFLYPLLQGYDSVAVEADVELGGTDQLFNLLVGRDLQREHGQEPQVALTVPLLVGTDGVQKMSQSLGNYVGIAEAPDDMFGKLVSIADEMIPTYRRLALDFFRDASETERVERALVEGSVDAWSEKRRLAREVVDLYHGHGAGETAQARFDRVHRDGVVPDEDVPEVEVPRHDVEREGMIHVPSLLVRLGLTRTNSEGMRLLRQGGLRVRFAGGDERGERIADELMDLPADASAGSVWIVGRRRSVRLRSLS
jgi:tyrosyl-tRNA synthetase